MVDLINQIDFKREIAESLNSNMLPQNIQAIKVLITSQEIILQPNSKTLSIDTRLIVNRKDFHLTIEDLKSRQLQDSNQLYSAFLGFVDIKSVTFLVMVDKCTHLQMHPLYKDFFHIQSTSFIPLDNRAAQNSEIQDAVQNIRNLLSKGFYFTYEKCEDIDRDEFMWNRGLCKQIYAQQIKNWDILLIQGFMDIFQVYLEGKRVQIALIAKRSFRAPGTRQSQTGVQKDGSVANFVETIQIVSVANIKCSFKQIRGSVPVYWKETGNLLMKKLDLGEDNQQAFENHFNKLIQKYERVLAINLMNNNKQTEHDLIQAYEIAVNQYAPDRLRYLYYNFDEMTKGVDFHIINQDIQKISDVIRNFQFDAVDLVSKQRYLKQKGIVRTNCLACLDRTNVYQQRIGLLMLEQQLKCMGLDLEKILGQKLLEINENHKQVNPIILLIKQMWGDHGDYISYHYTGTGSMHTHQDRQQQSSFLAILGSGMVPLSRFYRNNFSEHLRQESILIFLGNGVQQPYFQILDNDQSYLSFTGLDSNDLQRIGYASLYYNTYKQSQDGTKYTIYAQNEEQVIQIQCFLNRGNKYSEIAEQLKELEKKIENQFKIRRLDQKLVFLIELGTLNLPQLTKYICETQAFKEQQLLNILLEMATLMKKYKDNGLFLNGLTTKSVWFQYITGKKYNLSFDYITNLPTTFNQYPTVIKPDYMDPIIIQKIDQQERALEQQEDISNTNDLINLKTNLFTIEEVQAAQIWILGRILFVILVYPQPTQTNEINIMLPYLNQMIEKQKFPNIADLLKRMFRVDMDKPIYQLEELIDIVKKLIQQNIEHYSTQDKIIREDRLQSLIIPDKTIKQQIFNEKELRAQVDLCKHFRCYQQGLSIINELQNLIQEASIEDKIQQIANHLFFLIYQNQKEEAFEMMIEFQQLLDQCSETEITNLKQIIIDTNLLYLNCFKEYLQLNFSTSQLKEIIVEQPQLNITHPLKAILLLIWSQIVIDEETQIQLALKANESYRQSKVQHEYIKTLIHIQIIRTYVRKGESNSALEYIKNVIALIIGDTMEKYKLLFIQGKVELANQNNQQAIESFTKALKIGQKIYQDEQKLEELKGILTQIQ